LISGTTELGLLVTMFFLMVIPSLALPLPFAFLLQSFGPQRWAARRALLATAVAAAIGYGLLFAYFTIYGLPDSVRSNPQLAHTAAGQAVIGGFIAGGYASLAAFVYFYFIAGGRRTARP
jgi:hypothetical protein